VFASSCEHTITLTMCQVRPLLVVTENEEKLSQKETELRQVTERYERLKVDHDELERQHAQICDEKTLLSEQLRAEAELSSEAEEVYVMISWLLHEHCSKEC